MPSFDQAPLQLLLYGNYVRAQMASNQGLVSLLENSFILKSGFHGK